MNNKKDTRRDAWDRDYMGYYYLKEEPKSNKQISNATPVFIFALFYISGYDTWHDASQKGRSVGGIVATINPLLSRYVSFYFITH